MQGEAGRTDSPGTSTALKARILHERAIALAQRRNMSELPDVAEVLVDIVVFSLDGENYGVESVFVRQVQPLHVLTPVPCTPPFILGIVNIRGQIITVVDLGRLFELPRRGITDLDKLIILHAGAMDLGVLADAVLGVNSIPMSHIQESTPPRAGVLGRYLRGVTGDHITVLDAGKLLADERILVREEVAG